MTEMTLDTLELAPGWLIVKPDAEHESRVRLTWRGDARCSTGVVVRTMKHVKYNYHGCIVVFEPGGWLMEASGERYRVIHERQIVAELKPTPEPKEPRAKAEPKPKDAGIQLEPSHAGT